MRPRHPLALVAAVARNDVIGQGGAMPWHLPGDLAHFREVTMGHPMLMGRRTYQSIGRPLPGRVSVVVSRDRAFAPPGVILARSLDEAFARADDAADDLGADTILATGGGELYRALIGLADALWITAVDAVPAGDTLFPPIDPRRWRVVDRSAPRRGDRDSAPYAFERWVRRSPWPGERES